MKTSRVSIIFILAILVTFSSASIIEAANKASNYRNNISRLPLKARSVPATRDQQFQGYDYPEPATRNLYQPPNSKQSSPETPRGRDQQFQGYDYPEPASRSLYQPPFSKSSPETPGAKNQFQGYDYPEPASRNLYQPPSSKQSSPPAAPRDQQFQGYDYLEPTTRNQDPGQGLLISRGFSSSYGQPIAVFYITPESTFTPGLSRSRSPPQFRTGYPESRVRTAQRAAGRTSYHQRGPAVRNQNHRTGSEPGNRRFPVIVDSDSVTVISADDAPEIPSFPSFPGDNIIGISGTGLLDSYVPSIQGGIPYSYEDCY